MANFPVVLDLVLYGATGFTGRFVAEHLASIKGGLAWAVAGRDKAKMEALREEIGLPDLPIIVAEAHDKAQLAQLAAATRVVLTTAGPFNLYGSELLAACAAAGTDYADITGDPIWSRQMIDQHQSRAKASGARILLSAGFDSIPSELGVMLLQQEAIRRWGKPLGGISGRVRAFNGSFSGGSYASARARVEMLAADPTLKSIERDPFALTPGFKGPSQLGGTRVRYDEVLDNWLTPFVMESINTKNVHRSNFLLGHPYGESFTYDEMQVAGPGEEGRLRAERLAGEKPSNPEKLNPGEGPSREECETGSFDVLYYGRDESGELLRLAVRGDRDPGYGATSKILAETGLLLLDRQDDSAGGISLPGAALGETLAQRLTARAGISFEFET